MAKKTTKLTRKPRPVTPEDLTKFLLPRDPQISPDGSEILFVRKQIGEKNQHVNNLWRVKTLNGSPEQFTSGEKDSSPCYSPDGNTIAFLSNRVENSSQIFVIPTNGGEARPLTSFPEGSISSFKWSPDGSMLAVSFREVDPDWTTDAKKTREENGGSTPARVLDDLYYRLDGDGYFNHQRHAIFIVTVETGEHRKLFDKDSTGWFSFGWSPDSAELVVSANTHKEAMLNSWKEAIYRVDIKSRKVTKLSSLPEGRKGAVAWSPDGKWIAFAGREGKEIWGSRNTHLYLCDPEGNNLRNLSEGNDYCLSAVTLTDSGDPAFGETIRWMPDSQTLIANFGWKGGTHLFSFPIDGGKVSPLSSGAKSLNLGNLSADGQLLALCVSDATTLPEIAVGDLSGRTGKVKVRKLTKFNQELLKELDIAKPESHWVTSVDGNKVHLWVLKPPGKLPAKSPAVLEIHGGPHTQYGEAFFHEFQVLAAQGYIVVYSNPRGSKGYGEEHCDAIRGKWGQADWRDVEAVTQFMKEQPEIDENRMAVMGGSYGGYMTNWVIGHTNDFAAAITDRCVSNLVSMVGTSDIPLVPGEYWEGNSWDNTEPLWEQSPMKYFGNVKTPTLVIHSEGDLRCNVEQGEQVFVALKLRGIPTRFVRYPSTTSHGLSRSGPPDLRLHRLGQILEWLEEWLSKK